MYKGILMAINDFMVSRLGIALAWMLSLGAVWWFRGHMDTERTTAVTTAVTTVVNNASAQLQGVIDGTGNTINKNLTEGIHNAIDSYQTDKQRAATEHDSLLNLPNAGLYVVGPNPATPCIPAKVGPAAGGPGDTATYRAQLSKESKDFLASEAKRADDAADRLKAAQTIIVAFQKAVADYNAMLDSMYPNVPHVELKK